MPVNLPNFLSVEPQAYGLRSDLLEHAIAGYKASRLPKQIRQEEQQRELANRLLGHQGTHAEIINKFLPESERARISNTQAQTGLYGAQTRGHEISNMIEEELGMKREQANINATLAGIGLTQAQTKELNAMLGPRLTEALIKNQSAQNTLNAQPGKLAREEAEEQLKLREQSRKFENPAWEHGEQAGKYYALADDARKNGQEGLAKRWEDLAEEQRLIDKLKAQPKNAKVEKTPAEIQAAAKATQLGKEQAKHYTEATENLATNAKVKETAQRLQKLTEDPNFSNAVGPLDAATAWFMFPGTKEFRRELVATIGQAQLDAMAAFKGNFSDKDLKKIETISASVSDREASVRGYINALNNMSDISYKRSKLIAEQLANDIPKHTAIENAEKAFPVPDRKKLEKSKGAKSGVTKEGKRIENIHPTKVKEFLAAGGILDESNE